MKLVRYEIQGEAGIKTGLLEDNLVHELVGDVLVRYGLTGRVFPSEKVVFHTPCQPGKIVAVGLNYRDHAAEFGLDIPEEPIIFMKPASAVIGPNQVIVMPPSSSRVDFEGELAIVIGRRAKSVPRSQASDYILGYTCLNDVTARDLQQKDGQWTRSKSFDTFCPIGPVIVTELDPKELAIETNVNGQRKQASNTNQLIFDIPTLVSFISTVMTLEPGDVIATGTPSGVGPLKAGDAVEIRIEGIGSLVNMVEAG